MIKADYEKCTGCGACLQRCPQKCIEWTLGEFGFKYPKADENKCVNCGLCDKACPIGRLPAKLENQAIFALVNKDKSILMNSTSGGAFSALAKAVFEDGGVVYGCEMGPEFQVRHAKATSKDELHRFRGSKYVQSDTDNTYNLVKNDLKEGIKVLYSGTPCQIAGLLGFLGKQYDNLTTIDIVCHGVASQLYFDKFIEYITEKKPGLTRIEFRNKKFVGWSCSGLLTTNGKDYPFYNHEYYYYSYFLSGEIYRKSCYTCPYANLNRIGDLTLGDFWGVEGLNIGMDVSNGCSLVSVNTNKGKNLIDSLGLQINITAVDIAAAARNNAQLTRPSTYKESRKERLQEFDTLNGAEIQKKYIYNHKGRILKGIIKKMIPYSIKSKIRGM